MNYLGEMVRQSAKIGILAVAIAVLVSYASTPALAVDSAPDTNAAAQAIIAKITAHEWTPPDSADKAAIPATDAPDLPWAPTASDRFGTGLEGAQGSAVSQPSPQLAPAGTSVGAPGLGTLPYFQFQQFPLSDNTVAQVNLANGNLLVTSNDSLISGPGIGLRLDRFYNGLSTAAGTFGGGWSSSLVPTDVGIQSTSTTATFWGPSGFRVTFNLSGTTWTPPAGFAATLTTHDDGTTNPQQYWTITYNSTGEQLKFAKTGYLTKDVDRNGVGNTYAYSAGKLVSATNASGRSIAFNWTGATLTSTTDSASRTTTYTRDASNRLTSVQMSAPDPTLDNFSNVYEKQPTTYTYDSQGRLATITVPSATVADPSSSVQNSTTVTFGYDTSSRITSLTQQSYSAAYGNRANIVTSFAYSTGSTVVTDPNSHHATYTVDAQGRITAVKDAMNYTRSQTWTTNSQIATSTDALASGSTPGNTTTLSYDQLSNATGVQLPTGAVASASYQLGSTCVNASGGSAYETKCTVDAAGNKQSFQYDANGNQTKSLDTTTSTPATLSQHTYSTGLAGSCGPFIGQVCSSTDGNGKVTSYTYDSHGNLSTVAPPAPAPTESFAYDTLGRVTSSYYGAASANQSTTYMWDFNDHNIVQQYGQDTASFLDEIGFTYYDNGLRGSSLNFLNNGAIFETDDFAYDSQGHQTNESKGLQGPTGISSLEINVNYDYDPAGNVTKYTDPSGVVAYTYNPDNLVSSLTEPNGTCPASGAPAANSGCVKFDYNANSQEIKRTFPGGAVVNTSYDNSGRVKQLTAVDAAGHTQLSLGYSFAFNGGTTPAADRANIQAKTSTIEPGITAGAVTTYAYTSQNQLKSATQTTGSGPLASWTYTYDGAGNRTKQVRTGTTGATAGTTTTTLNADNEITATSADTSGNVWSYDFAGNTTHTGANSNSTTYTPDNAVSTAGSTAYSRSGLGNTDRVAEGSTFFLNTAFGPSSEGTVAPQAVQNGPDSPYVPTVSYTKTNGGQFVTRRASGGSIYYVADGQQSVVGMFSSTGAWLGGYSYSPYGELRTNTTTGMAIANQVQYVGGYADSYSKTYKLGARYYDPAVGRFTQPDPSGQESNQYSYASGNPTNNTDPSGLDASADDYVGGCAGGIIGAEIGAAFLDPETGGAAAVGAAALGCLYGVTDVYLSDQDDSFDQQFFDDTQTYQGICDYVC